jgi:hypothetical protein
VQVCRDFYFIIFGGCCRKKKTKNRLCRAGKQGAGRRTESEVFLAAVLSGSVISKTTADVGAKKIGRKKQGTTLFVGQR